MSSTLWVLSAWALWTQFWYFFGSFFLILTWSRGGPRSYFGIWTQKLSRGRSLHLLRLSADLLNRVGCDIIERPSSVSFLSQWDIIFISCQLFDTLFRSFSIELTLSSSSIRALFLSSGTETSSLSPFSSSSSSQLGFYGLSADLLSAVSF